MKLPRKIVAPLAIAGVGALGVLVMVMTRSEPETRAAPEAAPLVRVTEARPETYRYTVHAQGTVMPRTESNLVAQVSGEVVWVSPSFVSGGFFEKDDPLVRLDRLDQELELQSARAALARAVSEFNRSDTERLRQRTLHEQGVASQARIDDAENTYRVKQAAVAEERARLARAERDLERTELRAPFVGRVRSEDVDVGQFVARGRSLARLYAVDFAEVRLPIPDRELRFLDVPLGARAAGATQEGPLVRLRADFAGRPETWTGHVVRTEGEIDPRSRMVTVVARVEDPYQLHDGAGRAPLAVGLFVEAEIEGLRVEGVYVLPRAALRPADPSSSDRGDVVHVVDPEGRLRLRPVEVLRSESGRVILGRGLEPGERVSLSPLQAVIDGMRIRVAEQPPAAKDVAAGEAPAS